MSYDISLSDFGEHCDACGRHGETVEWNPTYNFRGMMDLAGANFNELAELQSGEALVASLYGLIGYLREPSHRGMIELEEPRNGWGTRQQLVGLLDEILNHALTLGHPRLTVEK